MKNLSRFFFFALLLSGFEKASAYDCYVTDPSTNQILYNTSSIYTYDPSQGQYVTTYGICIPDPHPSVRLNPANAVGGHEGESVTFVAFANSGGGTGNFTYNWYHNGHMLTDHSYVLSVNPLISDYNNTNITVEVIEDEDPNSVATATTQIIIVSDTPPPPPPPPSSQDPTITAAYLAGFGRLPAPSELSYWEGQLSSGHAAYKDIIAAIKAGLHGNVSGQDNLINSAYQAGFGRAPGASELVFWDGQLDVGNVIYQDLITSMKSALHGNAPGQDGVINAAYQAGFGRAPGASELVFWEGQLDVGNVVYQDLITSMKAALHGNVPGQDTVINTAYQAGFGRAPGDSERSFWEGQLEAGNVIYKDLITSMKSALHGNVSGQDGVINAAYQAGFGRAPGASELAFWEGQLDVGNVVYQDLITSMKAALHGNVPGQDDVINTAYQIGFGRAPGASELTFWEGQLDAGNVVYQGIIASINAALGR